MMADEDIDEKECPLCMEPFEIDDINFYPCQCEYQICRFCWHRIRTDENGLCPACRQPYPENPVTFKPLSHEELQRMKHEKKQNRQKERQKIVDSRKHLKNVRVLQRNLIYVAGLSPKHADADVLKRSEYFGKYGKIIKLVVTAPLNNNTQCASVCSAYVTYQRAGDALAAIRGLNGCPLDGRTLKASLGTTKYCSAFLNHASCHKPECMYLHELADTEASFTKEDMQAGKHAEYERRLLEQIQCSVSTAAASSSGSATQGAASNSQRCSKQNRSLSPCAGRRQRRASGGPGDMVAAGRAPLGQWNSAAAADDPGAANASRLRQQHQSQQHQPPRLRKKRDRRNEEKSKSLERAGSPSTTRGRRSRNNCTAPSDAQTRSYATAGASQREMSSLLCSDRMDETGAAGGSGGQRVRSAMGAGGRQWTRHGGRPAPSAAVDASGRAAAGGRQEHATHSDDRSASDEVNSLLAPSSGASNLFPLEEDGSCPVAAGEGSSQQTPCSPVAEPSVTQPSVAVADTVPVSGGPSSDTAAGAQSQWRADTRLSQPSAAAGEVPPPAHSANAGGNSSGPSPAPGSEQWHDLVKRCWTDSALPTTTAGAILTDAPLVAAPQPLRSAPPSAAYMADYSTDALMDDILNEVQSAQVRRDAKAAAVAPVHPPNSLFSSLLAGADYRRSNRVVCDAEAGMDEAAPTSSTGALLRGALAAEAAAPPPHTLPDWLRHASTTAHLTRTRLDSGDDLGFDPISESSKALRVLMMEEEQTPTAHGNPFLQQMLPHPAAGAMGAHAHYHQQQQQQHQQQSWQQRNGCDDSIMGKLLSSAPPADAPSTTNGFKCPPGHYGMQAHGQQGVHGGPAACVTTADYSPSWQTGGGRMNAFGRSMSPPGHGDSGGINLSEWQEGFKALLPNVNVHFAPNLQAPPSDLVDVYAEAGNAAVDRNDNLLTSTGDQLPTKSHFADQVSTQHGRSNVPPCAWQQSPQSCLPPLHMTVPAHLLSGASADELDRMRQQQQQQLGAVLLDALAKCTAQDGDAQRPHSSLGNAPAPERTPVAPPHCGAGWAPPGGTATVFNRPPPQATYPTTLRMPCCGALPPCHFTNCNAPLYGGGGAWPQSRCSSAGGSSGPLPPSTSAGCFATQSTGAFAAPPPMHQQQGPMRAHPPPPPMPPMPPMQHAKGHGMGPMMMSAPPHSNGTQHMNGPRHMGQPPPPGVMPNSPPDLRNGRPMMPGCPPPPPHHIGSGSMGAGVPPPPGSFRAPPPMGPPPPLFPHSTGGVPGAWSSVTPPPPPPSLPGPPPGFSPGQQR